MLPEGSNTYAGLIAAAVGIALPLFGYAPTPSFHGDFPALVTAILSIAGLAYAAWGRARAQSAGWFVKESGK